MGGGGRLKALVAGPLRKELFFAASLKENILFLRKSRNEDYNRRASLARVLEVKRTVQISFFQIFNLETKFHVKKGGNIAI